MAVDNTHQPYSAADIGRYIEGSMTKQEMRAIEVAAMDDPFLADAIEGYREAYERGEKEKLFPYLNTAKAYSNTIAEKKITTTVVVPLLRRKIFQYAVAAVVVLGSGWYIFNLSQTKDVLPPEVNTQKDEPAPSVAVTDSARIQPQNQAAIAKDDAVKPTNIDPGKKEDIATLEKTNGNIASDAFSNTKPEQKNEDYKNDDDRKDLSAAVAPGESKPVVREEATAAKKAIASETIVKNDSFAFVTDESIKNPAALGFTTSKTLSGKVVDKEKYPLDNITIQVKGTKSAVTSDEMGRFDIKAPDTASTLVASGPGYRTKEFKAGTNTSKMELELDAIENNLQEVVVSGYATSKRKAASKSATVIVLDMDTADAAPVSGWDNFTKYVNENKQVKKEQPKVKIVLSFEVDDTGHPDNIDIIESAGKDYDKEAIRLLKAGPIWKKKTMDDFVMAKITIVL